MCERKLKITVNEKTHLLGIIEKYLRNRNRTKFNYGLGLNFISIDVQDTQDALSVIFDFKYIILSPTHSSLIHLT